MGLLFDLLFKPVGPNGVLNAVNKATVTAAQDDDDDDDATATSATDDNVQQQQQQQQTPSPSPEWVLDTRDGGSLVWRRYDGPAAPCGRRRVEFLDAVQVRVFERDDYDYGGTSDGDDGDGLCWADDWSTWDDKEPKTLFYAQPDNHGDYPVLVFMSVTVLGLFIGITYLFAPVRWLFHHLLVD